MSNAVSKFGSAGLPSVQSLSSALRAIETEVGGGGMVILKMDKTGHWVFGADQTEVEDDSVWAVNPFSFVHGYIAWGDGTVLAETMAPITEPLPATGPAPEAAKRGWEMQIGVTLACTNGEDQGMQVRYSATSVGGKRSYEALASAFANQVSVDESKPVPVVLLKKEHYQHKSYGRIYTPIFEIVEFMSMDGPEEEEEAPQPTRRRRAG